MQIMKDVQMLLSIRLGADVVTEVIKITRISVLFIDIALIFLL